MDMRDLNKVISLTFDESPDVRIRAADSLEHIDDPAAVFALVELSYDKEPRVRKKAQDALEKKKREEREVLSFAELFSRGTPEVEIKEISADKKEKLLSPIAKMFERYLGKEKAETVKKKMMPTIERIYTRTSEVKGETHEEHGRKVIQEFLTGYMEVMSDIDEIGEAVKTPARVELEARIGKEVREPRDLHEIKESKPIVVEQPRIVSGLEEIGKETITERISDEISKIEDSEVAEDEEDKEVEKLPDTFFKKAYETMMLSGGNDELMKRETERMLRNAERDIKLAFKLAKRKFKEKKIMNITKIRDGMKNINTELLIVREVRSIEYMKKKKEKAVTTRILVNDENGNEGVVYLFDGRGANIVKPSMRIKIIKGQARTFGFSGETALTTGNKGEIYIVL